MAKTIKLSDAQLILLPSGSRRRSRHSPAAGDLAVRGNGPRMSISGLI